MVLRLFVGALLLVAFAGVSALLTHRSANAVPAPAIVTVNSTANSDDGTCTGAPNLGTGNCTLREAINEVNNGSANTIMFHTAVFGHNSKGVINVGGGLGGLQTIVRDGVTIDATNRGVILDGDVDGDDDFCNHGIPCTSGTGTGPTDGPPPTFGVIGVLANGNGFDFSLLGGKNFIIRNIEGNAVEIDAALHTLGHVVITGIITKEIGDARNEHLEDATGGRAINIIDSLSLNDISITNNILEADGTAVFIHNADYVIGQTDLTNSHVEVSNNRIIGDHEDDGIGDGVDIQFIGDLGSAPPNPQTETITAIVSHNSLIAAGGTGVILGYCDDIIGEGPPATGDGAEGCDLERSNINFEISNNDQIVGGEGPPRGGGSGGNAIDVDVRSTERDGGNNQNPAVGNNSSDHVIVNMNDNGNVRADEDEAVDAIVNICCGHSNSTSTINYNGNGETIGIDDEGIAIKNSVCCGNDNTAITNVTQNDDIVGDDSGVDLHTSAGNFNDTFQPEGCCAADGNTAETHVDDNGRIDGNGEDAVSMATAAGGANGSANHNTAKCTVNGNRDLDGDDTGVEAKCDAGSQDNDPANDESDAGISVAGAPPADADHNVATTEVNDNGRVRGDGSSNGGDSGLGIDARAFAGSCLDEAGGCTGSADNNSASANANGNEQVDGNDGEGIEAVAETGAMVNGTAESNTSTANANTNGDVSGSLEGIRLEASASADGFLFDADRNHAQVAANDNGRVTGHDASGVSTYTFAGASSCCHHPELGQGNSTGVMVNGNERIRGEGGSSSNTDAVRVDSNVCCDQANQNLVGISNNGEIVALGSEAGDGIYIGGSLGYPLDVNQDTKIEEFGICCSVNIVTIARNALIRGQGNDASGINYVADILADITLNNLEEHHSLNILTINDNLLRDSGDDGILICCGIFDSAFHKHPSVQGKSVIKDNVIFHNSDDGVDINSSSGINVGPRNIINNNGLKGLHEPVIAPVIAGGPPNNEAGNGVEIRNQLAWEIWLGCIGPSINPSNSPNSGTDKCLPSEITVASNSNRITQNSIYDNAALGIDLVGFDITPEDGDRACLPDESKDPTCLDEGVVGCETFAKAEIDPNNCLPYPNILIVAATDKIGGDACAGCTVELFLVDATPANQTGPLRRQFGEGRTYLASGTADQAGKFSIQLPCGLSAGNITATSTDKLKNTSEFSANHPILGTRGCATPTNTQPPPTNTPTRTNTPVPTTPAPPTNTPVPPTRTNTPVPPTPTVVVVTKACGDVNDDGRVNSVDAVILLQLKAGLITAAQVANLASGDVNGDGDITSVDAALVLQLEAGLIRASDLSC